MRTEAEILADIEKLERSIRHDRELLGKITESYPGQFLAQSKFVKNNAEAIARIDECRK
jgi:hypothetical protein